MDLKSLLIETTNNQELRLVDNYLLVSDEFIQEVKLCSHNIFVVKTKRFRDSDKFGLKMEDKEVSLSEAVDNGSLIDIKFFVFILSQKYVYYDGNKKEIDKILKLYFNMSKAQFKSEISLDDLAALSAVKVVDIAEGNKSIFQDEPFEIDNDILDLADDCRVKEYTREYKFVSFSGLKVQTLKDFINRNNSGTKKIYLYGVDKQGNPMDSDSEGIFSKKISINLSISTWKEKKDLPCEELVQKLKESLG